MEFVKRLWPFGGQKQRSIEGGGNWTVLYPSEVGESALLERNKEWVYVSVDKVARAVASVRFKVNRYRLTTTDLHALLKKADDPAIRNYTAFVRWSIKDGPKCT